MSLVLELERGLPPELPVGVATAVFCTGACFDTEQETTALEIMVDGVASPVAAFGMPRPDLLGTRPWPARALRCGFWGTVAIPAHNGLCAVLLEVLVRLADGSEARADLGTIEIVEPRAPATVSAHPRRAGPETIAICMATFAPDMRLFAAQIESLRAQNDAAWICLISDDGSPPEHYRQIAELIGDDPRFQISRCAQRQGFYRNFERALEMVPASAALIALCDQDDRWHPDKLAVLRSRLGNAILVYSDQRLVDADGHVLRDTMWRGRANNHSDLVSMLVANTVTGAATLFRRELLALALPFPDTPGFQFHDTWLSVIALAAGRVAYVDRSLYDYVQHPGAVFGDVTHGAGRPPRHARASAVGLRARIDSRVTAWRAAYFYGYLSRAAQAQVALVRCGETMAPGKRRALQRFVACDGSAAAAAWLASRSARALVGHTETLGSELGLVGGLAWKATVRTAARYPRLARGPLADASLPAPETFSQKRLRRWRARV